MAKQIIQILNYIKSTLQNLYNTMKKYIDIAIPIIESAEELFDYTTIESYKKNQQNFMNLISKIILKLPKNKDDIFLFFDGWPGHVISIFFKYNNVNDYSVGVINFGAGTEFHGITNNDNCNGIIIFNDIKKEQIEKFLKYNLKFKISNLENNYAIYYSMLFHSFGNPKSDKFEKYQKNKDFKYGNYDLNSYDKIITEINEKMEENNKKIKKNETEIIKIKKDILQLNIEISDLKNLSKSQDKTDLISQKIILLYVTQQNLNKLQQDNPRLEKNKEYFTEYIELINKFYDVTSDKNNVNINFYNIESYTNITKYENYMQLIGNCPFANLINFLYYLYISDAQTNTLEIYLNWYNTIKNQLKYYIGLYIINLFPLNYVLPLDIYNLYNYIQIILPSDYPKLNNISINQMTNTDIIISSKLTKPVKNLNTTHKKRLEYILQRYLRDTIENTLENIRTNKHTIMKQYINTNKLDSFSFLYYFFSLSLIFLYEFYNHYKNKKIKKEDLLKNYNNLFSERPLLKIIILILCCSDKDEVYDTFENNNEKILFYKKYILSLDLMHTDYNTTIHDLCTDIEKNINFFPKIKNGLFDFDIVITRDNQKLFYILYNNHDYIKNDMYYYNNITENQNKLMLDDLFFTNI
jgi:hypothetical protein